MNISLTPEQEQFIQEQLQSGRYQTIDEVIAQAFRLLEKEAIEYQQWVAKTRPKVAVGIEQLDRGEGLDGEQVIARLRDKFQKTQ